MCSDILSVIYGSKKGCFVMGLLRLTHPTWLKGTNSKVFKKTISDKNGLSEFADLDADAYVITAIKKGYKTVKQTTTLEHEKKKILKLWWKKRERKLEKPYFNRRLNALDNLLWRKRIYNFMNILERKNTDTKIAFVNGSYTGISWV